MDDNNNKQQLGCKHFLYEINLHTFYDVNSNQYELKRQCANCQKWLMDYE